MYVHVRDQNDNATYASTRWVPTVRHFLACEDVAGGSQQSGGKCFFREIRWPVRWDPAIRWRKHFFQLNKEEFSLRATMDLVGPSRQALHIQSSSDDSRLLTTPHRTQRGGGRRQGHGQERLGDGKTRQWSRSLRGGEGL